MAALLCSARTPARTVIDCVLTPFEQLPPISVCLASALGLDLDPARVLARAVRLIRELGDDALKALLFSGGEKLHRIAKFFRIPQCVLIRLIEQVAKKNA